MIVNLIDFLNATLSKVTYNVSHLVVSCGRINLDHTRID
jgi:hypothetical protein